LNYSQVLNEHCSLGVIYCLHRLRLNAALTELPS
jgi:hypothetical protein